MPVNPFARRIKNLTEQTGARPRAARPDPLPWRPAFELLEDRTTPAVAVVASSYFDSAVYEFNPGTGALLQTLVAPNSQSVLAGPAGMVVGPDGNLYFSSQNNNSIVEYNLTSNTLSTFIPSSVLDPIATANGDTTFAPAGLAFGPDGDLYVSLNGGQSATSGGAVVRFGIAHGGGTLSFNGSTTTVATGLIQPTEMTFGPATDPGSLYVSDSGAGTVVKIAGATGAAPSSSTFIAAGSGGLNYPSGLTFATNGDLYVTDLGATSPNQGQVLVYGPTGTFPQVFTQPPSGLSNQFPSDALFLPDGHLLTANLGPTYPVSDGGPGTSGSIMEFNATGTFDELFTAGTFPAYPVTGVTNTSPSQLVLIDLPSAATSPPPVSPPASPPAPVSPPASASPAPAAAVAPTVSVSVPSNFNPQNPLAITVTATDPDSVVQSVTVNWGDGTVQTFAGAPGSYAHQYAVSNSAYTIQVSVTDANGTFAAPAATVNAGLPTAAQGTVAALYLDLLGRSVDAAGLTYWSGAIASGESVSQVITGIMASPEYQDKVINNLYEQFLGRPADAAGVANALALLRSGSPETVAAALIGSPEFFAKAGGTDTGFLQALYTDVLGRAIDPAALTSELNDLAAGVSPAQIAAAVLGSPEAAQDVVDQAYQTYLGHPADPAGLPGWEQNYLNDPATFLTLFLSSPEVAQRAASDTTVVPTNSDSTIV